MVKTRILFLLMLLLMVVACSSDTDEPSEIMMVQPTKSSLVNAGEINDNEQWNTYLQYRNDFLTWNHYNKVDDVDVSQRHIFTVTDSEGYPVLGARVMVYDDQSLIAEYQTGSDGNALFFPSAWEVKQNYRVVVQKNQQAVEFSLGANSHHQVVLDVPQLQKTQLDVLFLLDSTGSMGDEIAQLQNNILEISSQINQLSGNLDVRYGLVTYRDRDDEYVTRTYDFVSDVTLFQTELNRVKADGGGDIPESLNEALHESVRGVSWRSDNTIKLIFLVADAPPHLDYANDYEYTDEMVAAAWQGIKINPIASSNTPRDAEYIFRQLAQYTQGNFIFLTYDNGTSGEAGTSRTDLEVGEGNYSVEQLDELVLRLITEEIKAYQLVPENVGVAVQTQPANAVAANRIPNQFSLLASPFAIENLAAYEEPDSMNLNLKPVLTVVVVLMLVVFFGLTCLVIGYLISRSRFMEKRKRKNDELIHF